MSTEPQPTEQVKDTRAEEEIYRLIHHLYLTAWADGKYEDTSKMVKKVDETYLQVLGVSVEETT